MPVKGGCFCGGVTYEVSGQLRDAASCHCSMCRRMFSSQASSYALFEEGNFAWISGENLLTSYAITEGQCIQFCSVCGSTLCGTYENKVSWITLGCVEGEPQVEIGMQVFVGSKAAWETIPDNKPHFNTLPTESHG